MKPNLVTFDATKGGYGTSNSLTNCIFLSELIQRYLESGSDLQ
jgi:hypothetical protein